MALKLSNFAGAGGGGSSGGHIAANSLFSNATLKVLDLISEGQIGGLVDGAKSIYFDDVPLQNSSGTYNYDSVEVDWVNGTPDQKVLSGFNDITTPQTVGSQVKYGLPITTSIDTADADKISCVVTLPQLYSSDKKGNINETSVSFRFEMAVNNTGSWTKLGDFTISGKQNSQYEKSYTFDLPKQDANGNKATKWLVRMTRLSEDSSERYVANTQFDSVYIINCSKLNYPYSALVGIRVNAENLSSVPTRSYLVDGLIIKIPSNYDRATNTYSGTWDGTFKMDVSDNPAWILYALLTNERWGLGDFIKPAQINKARLYEIGRYCDEEVDDGYGLKEKRFAINTQIQDRADAYQVISDIAAVFRGMVYWASGMACFTCDMPTDASMLYTSANVIDGMFTYQGTSRNDRTSVALVTWNDPDQNYNKVVEYVEDADLIAKWGIRQSEITAFGCTSRAQAIRAGRWILYTNSYESEIISFTVGLDSALVMPGDVVQIQDPNYAGKRLGGRLKAVTLKSATLDASVALESNSQSKIAIMMPDGKFVERNLIVPTNGEFTYLEWNEELPSLPVSNAVWMITKADLTPRIARIVNVEQGDKAGTFNITATAHQPKKYDLIEKGIEFTEDPTSSNDPLNITAPSDPSVSEVASTLGLGYISSVLNVTWKVGSGCVSYELQWRRENTNETDWATETTKQNYCQLTDVQKGTYHFILRGVGLMGNKTEEVEFYYIASGQYVTPLDVLSFQVIKRPSYLEVRWDPVDQAYAYEVRCGDSWDDSEILIASFSGTSFTTYQYEAGEYYYHIRSISASGEYSENVTTYKLVLEAPAMPEDLVATVYSTRIDFKWRANTEDDLSYYEMREGQSWSSGVKVAESKVSQMSIPSGSTTAERKFWLKAVSLPQIYSDDAAWCVINANGAIARNVVLQHNARTFGWGSNKVHMIEDNEDLVQVEDVNYSEYIHEMSLASKLTAQNSLFMSSSVVAPKSDDTETWKTATYPWDSINATRAWRLGGESVNVIFENHIARHIGLIYENEGWSLENTVESETGIVPTVVGTPTYDWGRYTKALVVNSVIGVTWEQANLNKDESGIYKFSFWVKMGAIQNGLDYNIIQMGNSSKTLTLSYNNQDGSCRLESTDGETLEVPVTLVEGQYIFFAIAQTKKKRQLGVGVLTGSAQITEKSYEPFGTIDFIRVGETAI